MRVLLIRHGQSQNNVIAGEAQVRLDRGEAYDEVFEWWLRTRSSDPDLSDEGRRCMCVACVLFWVCTVVVICACVVCGC